MCSDHNSLAFINTHSNGPYNASLASSASSSQSSVWSDTSSQHSDDTSVSATTADSSEPCDTHCYSQQAVLCDQAKSQISWERQTQQTAAEVPQELRQNPRRTSNGATTRSGCPPVLTRQSDRKVNFVDNLVGKL